MLTTLIKHEMKATAKTFMWLYIGFVAIVVVNVLANPFGAVASSITMMGMPAQESSAGNAFYGIAMALYVCAIIAIVVVTFVVVIMRFFRNLLGDEGYLMMTLPVTREENILAKLLTAVVWTICSGVLVVLSIMLLVGAADGFADMIKAIQEFLSETPALIIGLVILATILSVFASILMLYAAMGIGPNLLKNRVGGSILAFIIIAIVSQILGFNVLWGTAVTSNYSATGVMMGPFASEAMNGGYAALIGSIISTAVVAVVCWFLTRFMLKRKLNLA